MAQAQVKPKSYTALQHERVMGHLKNKPDIHGSTCVECGKSTTIQPGTVNGWLCEEHQK